MYQYSLRMAPRELKHAAVRNVNKVALRHLAIHQSDFYVTLWH